LFVQVAVVVLQEALGDSQLPDFLVFDYRLDRMLTPFETELERRVPQRVLELGGNDGLVEDPRVQQSFTYIFHLVVGIYIRLHSGDHGIISAQ
jgi:hypothetical protein